jgi:PKD repeat protein
VSTSNLAVRLSFVLAVMTVGACSSGLEGLDPKQTTGLPPLPKSTNLRFMFDPGADLTAQMRDFDVVGGVLPTNEGSRERPIAFVAFTTATEFADVDDPVAQSGAIANVHVAAVDANSIDTRAFTYSIAGTMRHPRCVTCHQMNVDPATPGALAPTAFTTQQHFLDGGGTPPLDDFSPENCETCHFHDWLAPGPSFDLRRETTRDLFTRAQAPPTGMDIHFRTDPRVLWALGNGQSPFGGAADDDHDGIDEIEDRDGRRRHTPGGLDAFIDRLDGLLETRDEVTGELDYSSADEAVHDLLLVSRSANSLAAGNAPASAPTITWVPDPAFDPDFPTAFRAGLLYIAYVSEATNMNGGQLLGFADVFRVRVDVFVDSDGRLDLEYVTGSQVLVSRAFDASTPQGESMQPDISANGNRVAFASAAPNLVNGLPTVCRPEVYVWDGNANTVTLVSHRSGQPLTPGNQGAIAPRISPDGQAVCFESDASNLVTGDTNGTRDVFHALAPTWDPVRSSVPDGGGEFTGHATHGSIHHANGDVRVAFAVQDDPLPPVASVQCPDQVIELFAIADARLGDGTDGDVNFGNVNLRVGRQGNAVGAGRRYRSLVRFDLSAIPSGSTIRSVELEMNQAQEAGDGGGMPPGGCPGGPVAANVGVHRATSNWVENTVTWNNFGSAFAASSANAVLQGNGLKSWFDDTVGNGLVSDVQSWVANSATNFGWLLETNADFCNLKVLDSMETSATFPRLTVGFSPPLAPLPAGLGSGACTVYMRDTGTATTHDLARIATGTSNVAASMVDVDGTTLPAISSHPLIGPSGDVVLFQTDASNLDVSRDFDENRLTDVVLVDLRRLDSHGEVLPYRLSVTADGGFADGASSVRALSGFTPPTDAFPLGLALFGTRAKNLGDTDPGDVNGDGVVENDNHMVMFVSEGGGTVADFAVEPERQGVNKAVAFVDASTGGPDEYEWDFGDGSPTSNEAQPEHVYAVPGRYTVTLSVAGPTGNDTRVRTDVVHVLGPVVATFSTDKDASSAPTQSGAIGVPNTTAIVGAIDDADPTSVLRFDADSTGSTEFPESFVWTLRPLNSNGLPIGAPVVVSLDEHPVGITLSQRGAFQLALEATGPGGSGLATQRIDVFQAVDAAFTTSPAGPIVRGPANLLVDFTSTSTGDVRPTNGQFWTFGDGASGFTDDPQHLYSAGVWFAELQAFGLGTDSSTSTRVPIIADGAITAAFSTSPQPVGSVAGVLHGEAIHSGSGVLVDFTNLGQQQASLPLFHRWTFNNGAATGQTFATNPTAISYATGLSAENVQTITVGVVTSTNNPAPVTCIGQPVGTCASINGSLRLYPRPVPSFPAPAPSFTSPSTPLRPPHVVAFDGNVVGDGTGTDPLYRWLRSAPNQPNANIQFASQLDTQFEFEEPGVYKVALEVETNGPGGVRQIVRSAERDVVVSASTFTDFVTQALLPSTGAKCHTCHNGPGAPGGLVWSGSGLEGLGTTTELYERLVFDAQGAPVFSTRCNTSKRRVHPFAPDESVLHNVLLDGSGPLCTINMRVNLGGDAATKDAHLAVLRSWILSGAPNN